MELFRQLGNKQPNGLTELFLKSLSRLKIIRVDYCVEGWDEGAVEIGLLNKCKITIQCTIENQGKYGLSALSV